MRLGYKTEDKNKNRVTHPDKNMKLGFHTTPTKTVSKPKAKPKPKKIILHSRTGFPTTPYRPPVPKLPIAKRKKPPIAKRKKIVIPPRPKPAPKPIVSRKKTVTGKALVSIIILNYNTLEVLKPCVASVSKKTVHPYELMVADNGSRDGSIQWAKKNKEIHVVVENRANLGWTKGNNWGIRFAKGNYFLLLNSDTVVKTRGWLRMMVNIAKSSASIGTVGAKLIYPNGTIQHVGGGIHKKNPYHPYNHRPARGLNVKNRQVPFNTGACLLIKRGTIRKVGMLDEQFTLGFGDVDYGLRVVEAGLKNIVCSKAILIHRWAYTQRKFKKYLHTKGLYRYHAKWDKKLPSIAKKVNLAWGKI